jgi:hypothetical protein
MQSTSVLRPVRTFSVVPIPTTATSFERFGIPAWCDDLVRLVKSQQGMVLPPSVDIQSSQLVASGLNDTGVRAHIAKPRHIACGTLLAILAQYVHGDRELLAGFRHCNVAYIGERRTVYFHVNKQGLLTNIRAIKRNSVQVWPPGTRFFAPVPIAS